MTARGAARRCRGSGVRSAATSTPTVPPLIEEHEQQTADDDHGQRQQERNEDDSVRPAASSRGRGEHAPRSNVLSASVSAPITVVAGDLADGLISCASPA